MSDDLKPPATAADCGADWIAERRAIIRRDGYALQDGFRQVAAATETTPEVCEFWIEIKSLTRREHLAAHDPLHLNQWLVLALPNGAERFATRADRDAVLAKLQETKTHA